MHDHFGALVAFLILLAVVIGIINFFAEDGTNNASPGDKHSNGPMHDSLQRENEYQAFYNKSPIHDSFCNMNDPSSPCHKDPFD
ncbi:hypothetical protein [Thioalkalivibrio sp. ALgr3]|uniref:hypothetical protein n=1 Tax=Thioalkalivibrio sp. ALgr3 TaxID=1239292 RepID=UPI0012DF532D|nr:hypothetical protein [Thioalkalivibrio sp. ALgr3]